MVVSVYIKHTIKMAGVIHMLVGITSTVILKASAVLSVVHWVLVVRRLKVPILLRIVGVRNRRVIGHLYKRNFCSASTGNLRGFSSYKRNKSFPQELQRISLDI